MTDTTSTPSTQSTPNEKPKRLYPSSQLLVALEARVLKTYLWILNWGGSVRYFSRHFSKAIGISEDRVERCIQALVDKRLVTVTNTEQGFLLTPNAEEHQKYFEIPLGQMIGCDKIKMADEATWTKTTPVQKSKIEDIEIDDMDDDQLEAVMIRLQASINERKQMKKFVKVTSSPTEKLTTFLSDCVMVKKRFQFWGRKDGKVEKMWSEWFKWDSDNRDPIQLKGFKGDHLLNEYKDDKPLASLP